jgi:hypothetical protein
MPAANTRGENWDLFAEVPTDPQGAQTHLLIFQTKIEKYLGSNKYPRLPAAAHISM